ncbi:MAG: hypothetical protein PHH85_08480 [Candidatus Methanoperedens sp.]|nr:hypothetical protein [Candidatus Methanoperedens sp.]
MKEKNLSTKTSGDAVYLIDTYAWVEYFTGSKRGEKVKKIIENENNVILTPECCLAELKGWAIRESMDFEELYSIVRKVSDIAPSGKIPITFPFFNIFKELLNVPLANLPLSMG